MAVVSNSVRTINYKVDLYDFNDKAIQFIQKDTTKLILKIYEHGIMVADYGTAVLHVIRGDGTQIVQDYDITMVSNVATILLDPAIVENSGEVAFELKIANGHNMITSRKFYGVVEPILMNGDIDTRMMFMSPVLEAIDNTLNSFIDGTLTELVINATTIRRYCIYKNSTIEKVVLHDVSHIGEGAFYGCVNLTELVIYGDRVAELENVSALAGTPIYNGTGYIYVDDSVYDMYLTADNWEHYAEKIKKRK